jgi:hypothetical protein
MLENTPMENNYRAYLFCLLFSIPEIMTSVFPPRRYWNPKRVMWMEYRSQLQWNEIYQGCYLTNQLAMLQERWRRDFKLSYFQFSELLDMLKPFIQKKDIRFRNAIPAAKALVVAIHRLAFGGVVRRTRNFLGIGPATTSTYTHLICEALVDNFYDKYIKIPKGHQLETIMAGFEKITNIPYMWGAIDGSHIVLAKKPNAKEVPNDYYNRHHSHSVLLHGVCDHKRRFLDICVYSLGGCHDATHLRMSSIWHKMHNDELPNKLQFKLDNEQNTIIQPYLLGDSAYPIRVGLLKCFTARGTSTVQRNQFDSKWRAGRARIENTF